MTNIIVVLSITGYWGYFIASWQNYKNKTNKLYNKDGICMDLKNLNLLHLTGISLLGFPLFFLTNQTDIFLPGGLIISPGRILVLSGLLILAIFVGINSARKSMSKLVMPELLLFEKSLEMYLPVRILFLIIYESFFRGAVLAAWIYYTSIEWAVFINVVLYTLMHVFSEKEEIVFCPLFGVILCLLTVWFHSVLPALLLHTTLAVSNEGYILKKIFTTTKQCQI